MEIKRLLSHFVYRIESNPAGGFIARCGDQNVAPLVAPTREELQQKIQAAIATGLAQEFPALKLPLENNHVKFAFHVEHKPEGGFALQSTDGKELPVAGSNHVEIGNQVAERVLAALGSHFAPEFTQALSSKLASGGVTVSVDRKVSFSTTSSKSSNDTGSLQFDNAQPSLLTNTPITPEPSKLGPFLRFLLAALVFAAIIYFLRYR
jgi:hypothetical protein